MTTRVIEKPLIRRVSWGALFAGLFVGLGIWLMLLMLVTAVGLSSVNARNLGSWADLARAIGIWGGIAGIIATFCGAWCAGRLCGTAERGEGVLHGVTVWGLAVFVVAWGAASLATAAISGAGSVVGGAASAVGNAAPAAGNALPSGALTGGVSAAVNGYLRENGHAPIPPQQLQAAVNDITSTATARIERGDVANAVDRQTVVSALTKNTNLTADEANAVASRVQQDLSNKLSQAGQTAQSAAGQVGQAAATGGRDVAWGGFVFLVLTFIAAIIGGAVAITRGQRRRVAAREEYAGHPPLTPQEV